MRLQSKVNWHHGKIERQDEGQTEAPGAQPNIQPRTLGAQATGQLEAVGTQATSQLEDLRLWQYLPEQMN